MTVIILNRPWIFRWHWVLIDSLAVIMLLSLAQWQWHRAADKQEILRTISQWQANPTASLADLLSGENAGDGRQIAFAARWVSPFIWLLDNQIVNGRPGYDVVIPVKKNGIEWQEAKAELQNTIVLINLGWIAAPLSRNEFPEVNIPKEFFVNGIYRSQPGGILLGKNIEDKGTWPMRIQKINNDQLDDFLPAPLIPGAIYQQQGSPFEIHYSPVVLPPERHRAYALQWLLLAIAALLIGIACARGDSSLPIAGNKLRGK